MIIITIITTKKLFCFKKKQKNYYLLVVIFYKLSKYSLLFNIFLNPIFLRPDPDLVVLSRPGPGPAMPAHVVLKGPRPTGSALDPARLHP